MTLPPEYFDDLYAGSADPWGFEDRWYEERKRALTLAALPQRRFRRAFEPGCSTGLLTAALAPRCDDLLAVDVSAAALATARRRLGSVDNVRLEQAGLPQGWPDGALDLVVVSEVGYYLDEGDLETVADRARSCLTPDGVLLGCHWRHPVADYPLRGDRVHEVLGRGLTRLGGWLDEDLRLDVWTSDPTSVGRREGLVG